MPVNRIFNLFIYLFFFFFLPILSFVGTVDRSIWIFVCCFIFWCVRDAVLCVLQFQLNRPSGGAHIDVIVSVSFVFGWVGRSISQPIHSARFTRFIHTNRELYTSFCHSPTHSFKANKQTSKRTIYTNTHAIAQRHAYSEGYHMPIQFN